MRNLTRRIAQSLFRIPPGAYWLMNALILITLAGSVYKIPAMAEAALVLKPLTDPTHSPAATLLVLGLLVALVTVIPLASGFMVGPTRYRSTKSGLAMVTLFCCWFAFVMNHRDIAWHGKCLRSSRYADAIKPIASRLKQQWPQYDDQIEGLGPFMAYPVGRPSTLILLTPPELFACGPRISAVERTSGGAIRFELSGLDRGDWIEWHPSDSQPASHLGGLMERFELRRSTPIEDRWYLVRYRG